MSAWKVGDQAFVIRGFCPTQESISLGDIVEIRHLAGVQMIYCPCGNMSGEYDCAEVRSHRGDGVMPLAWLQKIEPLTASETKAELHQLILDKPLETVK